MSIYRKILIAVDSSDEASQVLQTVAGWSWAADSEISVLHVAEHPPLAYGQWLIYLPIDESELGAKLLAKLQGRSAGSGLGQASCDVQFGRPIDTILEIAERDAVDLIVVGSHGRHGIKLLLGSTANGVLHRANCDVLAVRITED